MDNSKHNKRVTLILGSGGARGLAHIGVLDWLLQHDYEVVSIAGSSMGALIGGIYAAGELDAYRKWVTSLEKSDVIKLLDLSFSRGGLFKGDRIINKLEDLVGDRTIDELDINFTAVATELETGREKWFGRGRLFDAIRASIAVPLVFTPHELDGVLYVDGGLVNPVPIAPTLNDESDLTIAVNVDEKPGKVTRDINKRVSRIIESGDKHEDRDAGYVEKIHQFITSLQDNGDDDNENDLGFMEIMTRSIEIMQDNIAQLKLAAYTPDVSISIPRTCAHAYEFYYAERLIKIGYEITDQTLVQQLPG